MKDAVVEMVREAMWKIAAILRIGKLFTNGELVNFYKNQLISYLAYRIAGIYHACNTVLALFDYFQERVFI